MVNTNNLTTHLSSCSKRLYNILKGEGMVKVDDVWVERKGRTKVNDDNIKWAVEQRERAWHNMKNYVHEKAVSDAKKGRQSTLFNGFAKGQESARRAKADRFKSALYQVAALIDMGASFSMTESYLLREWLRVAGVESDLYSRPHLYETVRF